MRPSKLAVYGILRSRNGRLSNFMKGAKLLGKTKTKPEYKMYCYGCPVVVPGGDTPITVEVYEINEDIMSGTDMLEGYPNMYDRMIIDTEYGEAWMYFQESVGYGRKVVETGDWHNQTLENDT